MLGRSSNRKVRVTSSIEQSASALQMARRDGDLSSLLPNGAELDAAGRAPAAAASPAMVLPTCDRLIA
jgi:hypothetical protein